jgi:hypothetical protein
MTEASLPRRREFLGRLAAGAVALGLGGSASAAFASGVRAPADLAPSDKWLTALTGKYRQFFDMPNHQNGMGLLHVRNYLNTMRDTYHLQHPNVTAVVGLYGMSTMLGFNDAMWQKYGVANPIKVMDGSNRTATANVFADVDYIAAAARRGIHSVQQRVQRLDGPAWRQWRQVRGAAQGIRSQHAARSLSGAGNGRGNQPGADSRLYLYVSVTSPHVPVIFPHGSVTFPPTEWNPH